MRYIHSGLFLMTKKEADYLCENYKGLCVTCGNENEARIEQDVYGVKCDNCAQDTVGGVEELVICGRIQFVESEA
jgi:hypothetical protein